MSLGSTRSAFPLERLTEVCERFYARDGFVKWSDVGKALGVSRQAVQLRLRAAVDKGHLSPETVERWQSMSSRAATSREREEQRYKDQRVRDKRMIRVLLTEENATWLREHTAFRGITTADLINGMLTREREAPTTTPPAP